MIAKTLQRSPSTISRELHRGMTTQIGINHKESQIYFAETGQAVSQNRRELSHAIGMLAKSPEFFAELNSGSSSTPHEYTV
jgi:IS30 family transposase